MSQGLKILIRLDVDHHVGLAHAVRVSKILSLGGWDFDVHLIGNLPYCEKFFGAAVQTHSLDGNNEQARALKVVETAERIKADVLLVDHPHLSEISWDIFAKSTVPLIAIDDEGGPVRADLIFNGTVLDAYHHYSSMDNVYCGGKYALINPCFAETDWTDQPGLICIIGSGDRACEWALKITKTDLSLDTLIVGASFPEIKQLEKQCGENNIQLHQGLDQLSMARLMSQHSVGLITGGMIVYEALAVGLPVVVFPQEKNLPPEALFFAEQGCITDLGFDGGMDMDLVWDEIKKLMNLHEKRLMLSHNAKRLIDGKGMMRTVEIIDLFLKKGYEK